jgi:hypothetical protein
MGIRGHQHRKSGRDEARAGKRPRIHPFRDVVDLLKPAGLFSGEENEPIAPCSLPPRPASPILPVRPTTRRSPARPAGSARCARPCATGQFGRPGPSARHPHPLPPSAESRYRPGIGLPLPTTPDSEPRQNHPSTNAMNDPLLVTTIGLLLVLVAIERLAARAHRANSALWHAHYAVIPAGAIITAELRWNQDTWITAYVNEHSERPESLQIVSLRPLSSRERTLCLRWLRAEGFAEPAICRVGDARNRRTGDAGA